MSNEIERLTQLFIDFRDDRDWKKFHSLKNLAISLNVESAELLEIFQWKSDSEVIDLLNSENKKMLEDEVADVAAYLLMICNEANIDLEKAIINKIEKNNKKYPVDKCKGNSKKYTEL